MTGGRWLAALLVVALGACGPDTSDVSDDARSELQPLVAEIRELANARQADQVRVRLGELRLVVDDLLQRGELTSQGAADVRAATASIESHLELITTTTTAPPSPEDDDRNEDDDEEHDKDDDDKDDDDKDKDD